MSAHARFISATREALANPNLGRLLDEATVRLTERRVAAVAAVPQWEALRERARQIREDALDRLDALLLEFERQATARGAHVHWAATPMEACRLVTDIARASGARSAVKGKSMVSEEIRLNAALEASGVRAIESDLGEFIVQIAGETPSHIIVPAVHKSRGEIAGLFADKLGVEAADDLEALTRAARERLRAEFADAGLGLSGVNLAVAETGTMVLLENEGNIRLSTSMPRVHVALMGIEKVIPRAADLPVFLALLPRSATGQPAATYVSLLTGPRRPGELDGPDELHIVVLDNGRSALRADPVARTALACIRCGACLNACPVYRHIGGHAYGTVYAGPIGSLISSYLQPAAAAPDLPFASSLCGACVEVCPVKIDLPGLLVHLRARAMRGDVAGEAVPARRARRLAVQAWAFAMATPRRYRVASRLVRIGLRPLVRRGMIRWLPGPAGGWTKARDFPAPAPRMFREMWAARRASGSGLQAPGGSSSHAERRVAPGTPEARSLKPEADPASTTHYDLVSAFVRAARDAQADVSVVASPDAARERVASVLRAEGARLVMVSPDATAPPWSCGPSITATGARVVSRSASQNDRSELLAADAGVTVAAYGVADTGTLVLCSAPGDHRLDSLAPPTHVALVRASALVPDLDAAFARFASDDRFARHSAVTFVRGPSRTADIELTLTIGVHGPGKVYVIVCEDVRM